jgi:hypothetical protein
MTFISLILFKLRLIVIICCGYIIYRQIGKDKYTLIAAILALIAASLIFTIYLCTYSYNTTLF